MNPAGGWQRRSKAANGMRSNDVERKTYSVDEAAAILGISRSLAYECIKTGEIPSIKFRRRIVIPAYVIDQLVSESA